MTTAPAPKPMTVTEFLAWVRTQPKGRYELVDGEVVAMAGETADHGRGKRAAANALDAAIKKAGVPCEAFVDSLTVVIDDKTGYIPDALVNCGEPVPGTALTAPNPVIVFEVISPSSERIDTTTKLFDYFRVASIRHYCIVHLEKRAVIHYRREEGGSLRIALLHEGDLALDPPGLRVPVSELLP